jgi:uncharacterized protein YbaR (Trm112 family)
MVSYLMSKHIRIGGDGTRCACPLCRVDLTLRKESFAEWTQCPNCNMVGHSACIKRCVLTSNDTFLCPICRKPYDIEYMLSDPNAWSAVELQQRLRSDQEDDEYIGVEPALVHRVAAREARREAQQLEVVAAEVVRELACVVVRSERMHTKYWKGMQL